MNKQTYNNMEHVSINSIIEVEGLSTLASQVVKTADLNYRLEVEKTEGPGRPRRHYMIPMVQAIALCKDKRWDKALAVLEGPKPCAKDDVIKGLHNNITTLTTNNGDLTQKVKDLKLELGHWREAYNKKNKQIKANAEEYSNEMSEVKNKAQFFVATTVVCLGFIAYLLFVC